MTEMPSRIRKARQASRLTQAELAGRIGVKRSAVTQWEQADGTTPSIRHLIEIAEFTGVHLEWLAVGRGPERMATGAGDSTASVALEAVQLDEDERALLQRFRRLSMSKRRNLLDMLETLGSASAPLMHGQLLSPKL